MRVSCVNEVFKMNNPTLTTEGAAKYLGISARTLANWRISGIGPKYHKPTNKLIYYFQADLDSWIKSAGEENR